METKQKTVETYNASADRLSEKFEKIGARKEVIHDTIAMVRKENPFVLEIGSAGGRDADEILKYTNRYLGIDIAEKFVEMSRARFPEAHFEVADVDTFDFPKGIDVVISFASLIHSDKEALRNIFMRMSDALAPGGVARVSLKYADRYTEDTKTNEFGTRTYYYYSQEDIAEIVKEFDVIENVVRETRGIKWLEFLLRKPAA